MRFLSDVMNAKRCIAVFLGFVFVAGVVLVPILHGAHCAGPHDAHNVGHCPVCQIAHTPVATTITHLAPVAQASVSTRAYLPQILTPFSPLSFRTLARGPPPA